MSNMFKDYDKDVWEAMIANIAVSGVAWVSTTSVFRWPSNSTTAYPVAATTSGSLIQFIMYDKPSDKTYILWAGAS
jgi:hypothetical protein